MTTSARHHEELLSEIEELRLRLEEAEETLRAIGNGEVDAFVVSGAQGEQVFTLKGAEQPYRVLVETMNEGAATLAGDGTILYCNNRLAAMLQVPLEKLIGTCLISRVAVADQPLFAARLARCASVCDQDEIRMVTGAGNFLPVLISCCTLELSGNQGLSVVVTDLTQQKYNEEILASERLANAVIEQAGEVILICNEEGRIIRASRLAQQLCGENPLMTLFDDLFHLRMAETDCLFSVITPLTGGHLESVEVQCERNDGERSYLLLNATPLKSDQNLIIGCVVTLADITERKRAEESLRQSEAELQIVNEELQEQSEELQSQSEELQAQNRELKQAEEALQRMNEDLEIRVAMRTAELADHIEMLKSETVNRVQAVEALREKEQLLIQQSRQAAMGEMIGNIAHQWRQPLNALGLKIQQLSLYYEIGEFSGEFLEESVDSLMELINHMSRTIDDFRNFFKPDKEKAEFPVREAVAGALALVEESFKSQQIEVEVVATGAPVIYGFRNEFSQVLLNIMNNARDALTERGIDAPKVTITIGGAGGKAAVTIADNAGGVPAEILDRIFDPYFTTKGPQQGTGVGLFMSKVIIEKNMGGTLSVKNNAQGAEFKIEV